MQALAINKGELRRDDNYRIDATNVENMIRTEIFLDERFPKWKTYARREGEEDSELESEVNKLASYVCGYARSWGMAGNRLTDHIDRRTGQIDIKASMLPDVGGVLHRIVINLDYYYERMKSTDRRLSSLAKGISNYHKNIKSFAKADPEPVSVPVDSPPLQFTLADAAIANQAEARAAAATAATAAPQGSALPLLAADLEDTSRVFRSAPQGVQERARALGQGGRTQLRQQQLTGKVLPLPPI